MSLVGLEGSEVSIKGIEEFDRKINKVKIFLTNFRR